MIHIAQEGVQMLKYSPLSISEIAYSLGFEGLSFFKNFIKKRTGVSPTELWGRLGKQVGFAIAVYLGISESL